MEEQQVNVEVIAPDVEVHLPAHEGEPGAQLAQGIDDSVRQRLFQVPLGDLTGEAEELERVRILGDLLGQLGIGG
jgi:hypothetical protein